ncbi:EAL domain-containing protein, partial [Kaarinaea lacus]
ILVGMRRIVRERSLTMYAIYLTEDVFDKDDEFLHFHALAEKFIKLRDQLEAMGISAEQKPVYEKALELIRRSSPLQTQIIDNIMKSERTEVFTLMSGIDLPLEKHILATFDHLVELERQSSRDAVQLAKQEYHYAYAYMLTLGVIVAVLGVLITWLVIRKTSFIERALAQAKDQAEVTLHALGEAVITIDAKGKVVYLNPAAECLTGWSGKQAKGQPLSTIYHLKDEFSQKPVVHPAVDFTIHGQVSCMKQHNILCNRDSQEFTVTDVASPLYSKDGRHFGTVLVCRDVTQERLLANQLSWQAAHDGLTALVNRREFEIILDRLINDVRVNDKTHALLYMDLDQFKLINDTCGHVAGDELLKQLAQILKTKIRESDTLARLGGDEFGLLLEGCHLQQAEKIALQLLDTVQEFRFVWQDKTFTLGMSIGIAPIDEHSKDLVTTLSAADAACFIAKDKGRNRLWLHHSEDEDVVQQHGEMQWAARINEALDNERFVLYVQHVNPIKNDHDGIYHEFLLRLKEINGRLVAPMAFIPAAERYGIMTSIDRWVVKNVFSWLHENQSSFPATDIFSINISGQSLTNDQFLNYCIEEYQKASINPQQLCLEITETAAIANWRHASRFLSALKELGFKIALDDFGSGMSSFAYLKNLTLDYVKIDGSFVKDMAEDQLDRTLVAAINQIGQVMGLKTIAEFVDNPHTLELLQQIGVDYAQGFGIHKPEPLQAAFANGKSAQNC